MQEKYCKPYSVLVIDTTLASDNDLRFRKKYFRDNIKTNKNFNKSRLIIHQILTFKVFKFLQEKYCKPYSVLVIDATLTSDNALRFRKDILERI